MVEERLQGAAGRFFHHRLKLLVTGCAAAEALEIGPQAAEERLIADFSAQGVHG
jgi:hypothetical protein